MGAQGCPVQERTHPSVAEPVLSVSPPDDESQGLSGHLTVQEELQALKELLVLFLRLQLLSVVLFLCRHLLPRKGAVAPSDPHALQLQAEAAEEPLPKFLLNPSVPMRPNPSSIRQRSPHPISRKLIHLGFLLCRHHHTG